MNKSNTSSRSYRGGTRAKHYQHNNNSRYSSNSGGHSRKNRNKRRAQTIDPSLYVNEAIKLEAQIPYKPQNTFADFGLQHKLAQNLVSCGYTQPTPIQDETIAAAIKGRDVIGLANTGTGKTAAFIVPIIHRLISEPSTKRVLIIAPTRELTSQINDEFKVLANGMKLYSAVCVGGMGIGGQIAQLRRNPQVIIGTPGRLKDLINQRILKLKDVGILVLDEADRMLDMGFVADIREIVSSLAKEHQSLCFSATMTPPIEQLMNEMLTDPVTVSVRTRETSDHVHQDVIRAGSKEEKLDLLHEMLRKPDFEKVLIFGETKHGVQRLAETLNKSGVRAEAIHGNKSQPQRQRALNAFKSGSVDVLVATDVAARGLDIPHVSHVINFDQPDNYKDYVHRIGRTGRAGKSGKALTFINK